ncbi:hypothetical protein BS78_06G084000 [Paspalum vaginatum]|nr:hypothetical protein BS78_06G084000 [Paspalum vaginatum]
MKILRVVPKRLKQVAVAIEMLADLNTATIEELVGLLRVAEDADNEDVKEVTAKAGWLYLTEERWEARRRQRNKERARGGDARRNGNSGDARRGSNGGDGRHSDGNKGDGDNDIDDDTSSVASGSSRRGWSHSRGRCFKCSERGHIARFCCEEEETALL